MGQLGDLSPQGSIAVGIIVGLLSTSIQSLGLTLQRKSHLIEDAKDVVETRRPAYKRRKWQLGMFMFVISNLVGSTIQITTLPLPVLSTLQASGLVFNTAFATLLLQEPFTRFSIIGTILTCAGAGLIATFGAIGEPPHSLAQLLDLLEERDFIIWMVGTLIVAVATILIAHVLKIWSSHQHIEQQYLKSERPRSSSSTLTPLAVRGRSFTASLPRPLQLKVSRLRLIRGLSYGLISGILSAHSLLVAKSAVELLVRTIIDHNNQFNQFQSWLILIALLVFALTQLYYLHLGLRLCSTSVLYPFVFCIYNIVAILDGLIYFRQASRLSVLHAGLVALGTVVLLVGVFALSWRLDDSPPEEADQAALPPPTPLAPGMGIVRTSEDAEREPLLPTGRARSSTSASQRSFDERSALFRRKSRGAPMSLQLPMPANDTQDIWAELDDENDGHDFLASLPRTPSPFLTQNKGRVRSRRRGDSPSSEAVLSSSRRSSENIEPPRRGQSSSAQGRPDSALAGSSKDGRRSSSGPQRRNRSASVRFADDKKSSPQRSRWDSTKAGDGKRGDDEGGRDRDRDRSQGRSSPG